jgi:hypothetical protein
MKWLALGVLLSTGWVATLDLQDPPQPAPQLGYQDTPLLPGTKYRVHDGGRPQPTVVTPGDDSGPPSDAITLFDGKDLASWRNAKNETAKWRVADGYMEVNGSGGNQTAESFGDVQLHIEWAVPAEVKGNSQGRGNSGVFFLGRYEVQILDSHDNPTYPDGQAAAMYGQYPPLVNACRGPGAWQSYDIVFVAPRFDGDKLLEPARVTVFHNGVVVHNGQAFLGGTRHKSNPSYQPHPEAGPIQLQDHGNPVRFRNVWVRRLKSYDS